MALNPRYLVDNSALARRGEPEVAAALDPLITEGLVATCGIVELEVLYSARSPADYERVRARRLAGYVWVETGEWAVRRALEVQRGLARRSQHRGASLPDLLTAATAEAAGLAVLHYDADFDLIAGETAQEARWVVPRGTVT